jgi:hypothetical protein
MATYDKAMGRAAADYVKSMDPFEIPKYFAAAATDALYGGDGDTAWIIRNLLNGPDAYGDHLKANAGILLRERPNILRYFPAEFTRAVESRYTPDPHAAH